MAEGDFDIRAIISANTSNFERGMKSAQTSLSGVSKSIQGVQNLLKSAFSLVGITASVGAVVNFGKKAVTSADEANKRFNILANTIRATGASTWTSVEELDKMAKAYAESTNYSVSEVEKMQSVLLGFRNITGDTFEEASDAIMDMATVMGMDLTSAVQTVGKALDDPVKGLDSLKRQGFAFTEEQKAELAQLVKNGEQVKAQKIILDELATTYGGASKAGQSAFARLQHTMDEFRENIGNKLMPVVNMVMEKMSESMNKVSSIINSADFDRFIAIIVNVGNKVRSVLENISGEIKKVFDSIKSTFGSIDFSPVISLMDTLLGVVKKIFGEIKTNIQNSFKIFDELKEKMSGFTNLLDLDKIVTIINTVVDVFFYLRDMVKEISDEIRKLLFDNIVKIWDYLKQVFDNSNNALENSKSSIQSWGQFFYETLDNVFKIFQDLFGSIKAILSGDWEVAWEYAKLAVMRMADNILNALSTIMNAFPKMVNKIIDGVNAIIEGINKVRNFLGQDPLGLIDAFKSVDLSESSGLNAKITQAEKRIEELTGKSADISIKQLQGISKVAKGTTQKIVDGILDTTDVVINNADKRQAYEASSYQGIENDAENTYKTISDWDLKLLQQQLDGLKDYSGKYHDISLQIIEAERQKALEADKTGADTEKINKYYNKQIELENKRHNKAVLTQIANLGNKVAQAISKIASKIINGIKGAFGSIKNILGKLFDFNPDEALDNLLKFEDSILTFFVETLPKMPAFVKSALQSIAVLFKTLTKNIDKKQLSNIIKDMVKSLTNDLPSIVKDLIEIGSTIVGSISESLLDSLPELLNSGMEIINNLINSLISFLPSLFATLSSMEQMIMPKLQELLHNLIIFVGEFLKNSIPTVVQLLFDFIGILIQELPGVIQILIESLPVLIDSIMSALPKFFAEDLPNLISGFIGIIPDLVKACIQIVASLITHLPEILGGIISGIVKIFTDTDWAGLLKDMWKGIKEGFESIGKVIGDVLKAPLNGIIEGLNWIIKGLNKISFEIPDWVPVIGGKKFGVSIKEIKKLATGTQSAQKGLAIVGEKGPELVNFKGGEQVINNFNTQKLLTNAGNSSNNFSVVFNNTKDTTAYTMMRELKQYNRQMAINGII